MGAVANLLNLKGKDVLTVGQNQTVREAIEKMASLSVGTSVVVENEKVVGIISERDVLRKVVLTGKTVDDVKVKDIMSSNVISITSETLLAECMQLMTDNRIRHLPVLCDGALCGIVSIGDVVKYLMVEKDFTIKNLETYISGTM